MDADLKPGMLVQVTDADACAVVDIRGHGRLWIVQEGERWYPEHTVLCRSIATGTVVGFYLHEITAAPTKET